MVYDFNNDGKAELVCKTADATVDGKGNVIGDKDADYRNKDGFILEGPEYLTLFNGETGEIMDTVDYDPPRGNVREWGDSWGNRVDRFLACVAYLDGENPSVVMCRGYYDHGCPTVLVAYDVIDNKLVKRWKFLANKDQNIEYTNQGNHNLGVGDIDGDGLDEIVYGAMAVDHDGKGIYSTGLEHGDCMNLGNFTKKTPNLDFFQIHEHDSAEYGFEVRDPATGEIKWGKFTGRDTTRGLCAKIDPRYEGNQCWVMDDGIYTIDGELINEKGPESIDFAIWWDGDLIRELLDHEFDDEKAVGYPKIYKWDYENNLPLDKDLLYVQAMIKADPDFETKYNNRQLDVNNWPNVTLTKFGKSIKGSDISYENWDGNPNGFKFGSKFTTSDSTRTVKDCIAFNNGQKGFDENNSKATIDMENTIAFDNGFKGKKGQNGNSNYRMELMNIQQFDNCFGFNGAIEDFLPDGKTVITPDSSVQDAVRNATTALSDSLQQSIREDKIPGMVWFNDIFALTK